MKAATLLMMIPVGILLFPPKVYSQGNLVANGSFEIYSGTCPFSSPNGAFVQVVGWKPANAIPGIGVPHADLYCQGTPNYLGCMPGPLSASDGNAYVGFHTRNVANPYNEAVYQELPVPLTTGNNYRIEFDLVTCASGLFTSGISDFCVYANTDTIIPACPAQNPAVIIIGCVPFSNITTQNWSHHHIDFIAPPNANVLAFSGGACFTTDIYYYFDNVILTEATGLNEINYTDFTYTISPQPVNDILFVRVNKPGTYHAEIFNVTGSLLFTSEMDGMTDQEFHFNNTIAPGIYFIRISDGNKSKCQKFIKN